MTEEWKEDTEYLSYIEDKTMTLYNVKDKKVIGNYKSPDKLKFFIKLKC